MASVIVTVYSLKHRYEYDLELPADLEYDKLIDDMVQTIVSYNPSVRIRPTKAGILLQKYNYRPMQNGDTLDSCGIYNGDFIVLEEVTR